MTDKRIAILGAGPAGISAAYHLKQLGYDATVYEKRDDFGGLCGSFKIGDYRFDRFAHMTFSKDPVVNGLLELQTECIAHTPEAYNFYQGKWVRNPVQNNLIGLNVEERIKVIEGFLNRPIIDNPQNYKDWLRKSYGDYFADNFPSRYTRKYWTVEPEQLETEWVRNRMYVPDIREVLRGAMTEETPNVHYSKEMHYPVNGGFRGFMEPLVKDISISYEHCVDKIDIKSKRLAFSNGVETEYDEIISTLPISDVPQMIDDLPQDVCEAANKLDYTSGYMISLGFNREIDFPCVWFYIYDEDILPARIYFSNKKSPDNVPEGCSALQAEVYVSKYKEINMSSEELKDKVIEELLKLKLFTMDDIAISDIRFEKYANIMFTPAIYEARDLVKEYLNNNGVILAGRFGEWDYLWLEQSLLSGKHAAEIVMERMK